MTESQMQLKITNMRKKIKEIGQSIEKTLQEFPEASKILLKAAQCLGETKSPTECIKVLTKEKKTFQKLASDPISKILNIDVCWTYIQSISLHECVFSYQKQQNSKLKFLQRFH